MPKIDLCDRCLLYSPSPYVVFGVHPEGVEGGNCIDFRPDPQKEPEEKWSPQGAARSASDASRVLVRQHLRWYGNELIRNHSYRTKEEQEYLLDNHPFFTGVCPECGYEFDRSKSPRVHA